MEQASSELPNFKKIEGIDRERNEHALGIPIRVFYDKDIDKFSFPYESKENQLKDPDVLFQFIAPDLIHELELADAGKPSSPTLISRVFSIHEEDKNLFEQKATEHNSALILDYLNNGGDPKYIVYTRYLSPEIKRLLEEGL